MGFETKQKNSLLSRREFFFGSAAFLSLRWFPIPVAAETTKGCLLAPSMQSAPGAHGTLFSILNLDRSNLAEFQIPLELGHSWAYQPGSSRLGCVPESGGREFCILDLKEKRSVALGKTLSSGLILGGHVVYSPDGQVLYLSQFDLDNGGAGSITARDAKTLHEVGRLPTHGQFPHELYVRDGGKEILIANLGADPANPTSDSVSFARIETASGKMLDKSFVRPDATKFKDVDSTLPSTLRAESAYFLGVGDRVIEKERRWGFVLHPHARAISVWNLLDGLSLNRFLNFAPKQPVAFSLTHDLARVAVTFSDNSLTFLSKGSWTPDIEYTKARHLRSSTHLYSGANPV